MVTQDHRAIRRTAAQQTKIEKTGSNPAKRSKKMAIKVTKRKKPRKSSY